MEDLGSTITLPLRVGIGHCDNAMEITQLKLITETARLLPDSKSDTERDEEIVTDLNPEAWMRLNLSQNESSCFSSSSLVSDSSFTLTGDLFSETDTLIFERCSSSAVEETNSESATESRDKHGSIIDSGPQEMCKLSRLVFPPPPLWGHTSICGRRPEMEDAFSVIPAHILNGEELNMPSANFFGVYDGHGGAQVDEISLTHILFYLIFHLI